MKKMSPVHTEKKKGKPTVVVVDANRAHLDELARHLRANGFHVVSCRSMRGALGQLRRTRPDAVILEVIMPGVSGFELAARMQADVDLSHIPIIFTSDIQNSEGENHDYFPRPLDMDGLVRSLKERIATRR